MVAYGAGCTGPLASLAPDRSSSACAVWHKAEAAWPGPLARWPARRAPSARSPCTPPTWWRGRQWLASGREAARSSVRAPPLRGGCAGQGEWRWGSPEQRHGEEAAEKPRGNDIWQRWRLHGGHRRPWCAPAAWRRRVVSRGGGWLQKIKALGGAHR
jgi:hypothetical protein